MRECWPRSTFWRTDRSLNNPEVLEGSGNAAMPQMPCTDCCVISLPKNVDRAAIRLNDPGEHVDERALAGTIRARSAHEYALPSG